MLKAYQVENAHMQSNTQEGEQAVRQRIALAVLKHTKKRLALHQRHLKHHLVTAGGVAFMGICAVWAVGNIYGMRFNLQGTVLSGANSDAQLARQVQAKTDAYRLRITQPNGVTQSFTLAQVGLRVHTAQTVAAARVKQHSLASRLAWWRPIPLSVVTTTDTKALADFVAHHATLAVTPAQNASMSIEDGDVKVTEGKAGTQYGFASPAQALRAATANLQSTPLHMRAMPLPPGITAEKLATVKKQVDATLKQPITITVGDEQVHPSARDIASWVSLVPDITRQTETLTVNTDAVQSYLESLASDHSHPPRTQVISGGNTIPGSYGITVTGTDAAAENITQNLLQNKGLRVDLPVSRTAYRTVNAPTSGKWIEVDLTTKRLYVYTQNSLVRTFLVSAGARATPTVTGTYAIYAKYAKQTMSGANADGSHYVQPNVPWINYFYRDYAIHGNYWRPASYFGNINSSHGCVGLRTSDAGWIYDWAPIGTPVITHY